MAERTDPVRAARPGGGPHPGVLAIVSLALLVASLVTLAVLTGGTIVSPYAATPQVVGIFQAHPDAVRLTALLQLGSAVPLGICAAALHTRLRDRGLRVPGPTIGLVGGVLAAGLLIVSATLTWTQGQPAVGGATLLHALAFVAFATGGFAHVACLGLLVAGVAVPGLLARLLPAWLAWVGLVVAAISELSLLAMVLPGLAFLIPLGRFGSLVWLVAAGFLLPAARARRTVPDRSEPS